MKKQIIFLSLIVIFAIKIYAQKDSYVYTKTYYSNGHLHEEGCAINRQRQGLWNAYNELDSKIRFIWTYKNNLKDGPYKVLGGTGLVEAIGTIIKVVQQTRLNHIMIKGN